MSQRTLLVSGASGHLGRLVLETLAAVSKNDRVIAGTRSPDSVGGQLAKGVEIRELDFDRPDTLAQALAGVDRFLIISTDAHDRPGRRGEQHSAAIAAAKKAGVKHIVYTSMPRPAEANFLSLSVDHRETEQALIASGVPYTVLRNNWYFENIVGTLAHSVQSGVLSFASGEGRIGWVTREDCARAAAYALASTEDKSSVRDITGPELLDFADLARELASFSGKKVLADSVDGEARKRQFAAAGLPAPFGEFLTNAELAMAAGWLGILSDDVKTITGSKPISFSEFLQKNKTAIAGA